MVGCVGRIILVAALLALPATARAANNVPTGPQCPASPHCWIGTVTMTEVIDSQLVEACCTTTNKANNQTTINVDGMGAIVAHESPTGESVFGGEVGSGDASLDYDNTVTNYNCGDGLGVSHGTLTGSVNGQGRVLVLPDDPDHPTFVTISAAMDTNLPTTSTYDCNSDHSRTTGVGGGFSTQTIVNLPAGWDGLHLSGSVTRHVGDYSGTHDMTITWSLSRKPRVGCLPQSFAEDCTGTLHVSRAGTGTGTVTSQDRGITCPDTCSAPYAIGTRVDLTPTPAPGSVFDHWEGACTTSVVPCTVLVGETTEVTAVFQPAAGGDECTLYSSGINGCALEPGDILLWRSQDPSLFERFLGDTYWSHSAIVIGYLNLDESDPGRELVIADAEPGIGPEEVSLRDITDTPWGSADADRSIVQVRAFRLEGVPAATREAAAKKVLGHLLGAGGASLAENHYSTLWKAPNFHYTLLASGRGDTAFYCSGLVWWGYHNAGVDIDSHDPFFEVGDHLYVTPDDLISDASLAPRDVSYDPTPVTTVGAYPGGGGAAAAAGSRVPAHVLLVDARGRKTGQDASGRRYNAIPGALWRATDHNESVTAAGFGPGWKVIVSGTRTGAYKLLVRTLGTSRPAGAAYADTVVRGRSHTIKARALAPRSACRVPALRGKSLSRAKALLRGHHCALGRVTHHGPRVRAQTPRAGTTLFGGAKVALRF